jgi:signal peptidase I
MQDPSRLVDAPRAAPARARRLRQALWIALALAAVAWLVFVMFFGAYRVASGSMEPTLFGPSLDAGGAQVPGELVLVRLRSDWEPRRFDLVVHERAEQPDPVVKRVVGMPGESVQIVAGDVVVNGARLGIDEPRAALVPLFDSRVQELDESFAFERGEGAPWRRVERELAFDGVRGLASDAERGLALDGAAPTSGAPIAWCSYHPDVRDEYRRLDGTLSVGTEQVGDGAIAVVARVTSWGTAGELRLRWIREGQRYDARVGRTRIELLRGAADGSGVETSLASAEIDAPAFDELGLSLVVRDHHVELWLDDARVLVAAEPAVAPVAVSQRAIGIRAAFGAAGLDATFRAVSVLRDLHAIPIGEHAIAKPLTLGPDEYFLLGDNSAHSFDSRSFGPLRAREIVGQPVAVLWPPSRWRRLRGAVAGPPAGLR